MTFNVENADSNIAVKTESLTKTYVRGEGRFNAVDDLNLNVPRGEFLVVMGASGSGKSTALHLIAGLTRPTKGRVEVEGRDIFALSDAELTKFRRRRVGVVFQSYNLIPHLTARENILFPLRADARKIDAESLERLQKFWEELEIADQLDQYPDSLSGGQQQRVAIARALVAEPAAILADEPTGNLDWTSSQTICRIFDRIHREEKRTIILVTHEPAVAIWGRRVVVLRDGKIVSDSETSRFKDAAELAEYYQEIARGAGGNEQ